MEVPHNELSYENLGHVVWYMNYAKGVMPAVHEFHVRGKQYKDSRIAPEVFQYLGRLYDGKDPRDPTKQLVPDSRLFYSLLFAIYNTDLPSLLASMALIAATRLKGVDVDRECAALLERLNLEPSKKTEGKYQYKAVTEAEEKGEATEKENPKKRTAEDGTAPAAAAGSGTAPAPAPAPIAVAAAAAGGTAPASPAVSGAASGTATEEEKEERRQNKRLRLDSDAPAAAGAGSGVSALAPVPAVPGTTAAASTARQAPMTGGAAAAAAAAASLTAVDQQIADDEALARAISVAD